MQVLISIQVGESQSLRQQLESAKREVEELREMCRKMETERQELVTRNGNVTKVADSKESTIERKQAEESDGRSSTPQPDYPTSPITRTGTLPVTRTGTLGERDMAKGEEVVVQALTISLDTFRQRYQQHPPPTNVTDGNWHLKESNGHYAKSRNSGKTHFHKTERRLPKTPDPGRRKELIWNSEQFEQMLGENLNAGAQKEEETKQQQYNTMETMSTRSFGFSRPSGSFVRRERERRLAQHRAQFVLQETSLGGQKMIHYRKSGKRARGEERTPSLARSKSMDMVAMANRTDDGKRRVLRASSVSRVDDDERDWREQTPFLSPPRRNGRRGDRTSWGLDDQGPIFEVADTAQRQTNGATTHLQEAINPSMGERKSGRRPSPPPPVPTPDYPDPPPLSS